MAGSTTRWLLLVTLCALGFRLVGIGALLPQQKEPDAYIVDQTRLLRMGGGPALAANPVLSTKYPHLLARLLALVPLAESEGEVDPSAGIGEDVPPEAYLEMQLERAAQPYLIGRLMVAFLSVLLVPATWLLVRRFAGPWPSLFASALIATSLLHIVNAQQARPHAPEATFALFALLALLKMRRDDRWIFLVLSGVAAGLAVGTLQNGFILLGALVVAAIFRKSRASIWWRFGCIVIPLAVIGGFIWAFYPSGGGPTDSPLAGFFRVGGMQYGLLNMEAATFYHLPVLLFNYDPVMVLLALLGVPFLIRYWFRSASPENRRDLLVLLAFALPYTMVIGLYGENQARYLLPLLPFLAGLSALGVFWVIKGLGKVLGAPRAAAIAVVTLVLALPLYVSGRLAVLHTQPDTLTQAAQWLEQHADHRQANILVQPGITLPLFQTKDAIRRQVSMKSVWWSPWSRFQRMHWKWKQVGQAWDMNLMISTDPDGKTVYPYDEAGLRQFLGKFGTGYIVIKDTRRFKPWTDLVENVRRSATKVAQFPVVAGGGGGAEDRRLMVNNGYQDFDMLERVLRGVAWGPPIELYRFQE